MVLQVLGMSVVLMGLMVGISNPAHVKLELMYLGVGILVFYVGHILRRRVRD